MEKRVRNFCQGLNNLVMQIRHTGPLSDQGLAARTTG